MSGVTKWLLFRIPGGIAILLAMSWLFRLLILRMSGQYDITDWVGLWPWALGLWLGGSFWMAIPTGFGDKSRSRQPRGGVSGVRSGE